MLRPSVAIPVLLCLALSQAGCANQSWGFGGSSPGAGQPDVRIVITDDERKLIRDYYADHPQARKAKRIPPGLQKKVERGGELPPGWQMKIARGEVVPEDVWAWHLPLPPELVRNLPRAPDGVITVRIEGRIVRLYEATRVILDVFDL